MCYRKYILVIIFATLLFIHTASTSIYCKKNQELIRLHVIANSDSPKDQNGKLMVRDRLLSEFGEDLGQCYSFEESYQKIKDNINIIESLAQDEVDKHLPGYKVKAVLGRFDFPTKAYGNMILPAGNYEALRIIIGEGEGANWWCVMFPPLCFVDITHGVADEEPDHEEESPWEDYDLDGDDPVQEDLYLENEQEGQVEYRFKIVEWWNDFIGKF